MRLLFDLLRHRSKHYRARRSQTGGGLGAMSPHPSSGGNGGGGIRTLVGGKSPETVFETAAFNRSATPPCAAGRLKARRSAPAWPGLNHPALSSFRSDEHPRRAKARAAQQIETVLRAPLRLLWRVRWPSISRPDCAHQSSAMSALLARTRCSLTAYRRCCVARSGMQRRPWMSKCADPSCIPSRFVRAWLSYRCSVLYSFVFATKVQ
jgi:hypothetical protein